MGETVALKIEKGVPLPRKCWSEVTDALAAMEVGDSFYVDRIQQAITGHFGRYKPKKFATRKDGAGTRVWRIA